MERERQRVGEPVPAASLRDILSGLGVEPCLTVSEVADLLRWSPCKARRYFRSLEGICVSYQPKRYKRAYRTFTVPVSVFVREWQKMTGRQADPLDLIRLRVVSKL
jgi:hypothetical protein